MLTKINSKLNIAAASGSDDGCRAADSDMSARSCSNDVCVFFVDVTQMCQRVTNTRSAFEEYQPKKEWWLCRELAEMRGTLCVFIVLTSQPRDASKIWTWFWFFISRFLQHFALSSVSQEPILEQHLGVLFPSTESTPPATSVPRDHVRKACPRQPSSFSSSPTAFH